MNKILIVIDAQEDFTRGALRNEEAIAALPIIRDIVKYAKENKMKIFYTADTHGEDYIVTQEGKNLPIEHCIYRTDGWKLCEEVIPEDDYPYDLITKDRFGYPWWYTKSDGWSASHTRILEYADEIWICGFCTDICVSANFHLLKTFFSEVPIVIISDGCAGVTPELHEAALKVMASCQANIKTWSELKINN